MGDLNCKVGNRIRNNREEVTKGGRILMKLLEEEKMEIINSSQKCIGKWTRRGNSEDSRSILITL